MVVEDLCNSFETSMVFLLSLCSLTQTPQVVPGSHLHPCAWRGGWSSASSMQVPGHLKLLHQTPSLDLYHLHPCWLLF